MHSTRVFAAHSPSLRPARKALYLSCLLAWNVTQPALAADDPIVMLGYWGRPDLTAQKISGGWVRLGDRGLVDEDGFLRFEGRLDDLIKVSGIQVGAEEVEAALLAHPAVAEAGVCAVTRPAGGGDTVAAFIRLRPGATVEPDELRAFAREDLAPFKVPKSVVFVDELPKNPSGKILKRELRAQASSS